MKRRERENVQAVYLRLQGNVKDRFNVIKEFLSLENDTELCRVLINDYYMRNRDDLEAKLHCFYVDSGGDAYVIDPEQDKLIKLSKTSTGFQCPLCQSDCCKHVQFVLIKTKP